MSTPTPTGVKNKKSSFFFASSGSDKFKSAETETPANANHQSDIDLAENGGEPGENADKEDNKDANEDGKDPKAPAIKFKRKKKRLKGLASQYFSAYKDLTYKSRFSEWTKNELTQLLVQTGIELRNENLLSHGECLDLVDALYEGQDMPAKPRSYGLFEYANRMVQARRIQFWYRCCKAMQKYQEKMKRIEDDNKRFHEFEESDNTGMGHDELLYMSRHHELVDVDHVNLASSRDSADLTNSPALINSEGKEMELTLSPEVNLAKKVKDIESKKEKKAVTKQPKGKKKLNVLDIEWTPPDIAKAERYADQNQPRKNVKTGRAYDFNKTTTGRHCFYPSNREDESCAIMCAEQWDAWEEGQVSEFQPYGSGVVNYFKFIKWCIWLFIILFVISSPSLIFNIYGPNNISSTDLNAIARTTFGNLLSKNSSDVHELLHIPGCYGYEAINIQCNFNRYTLAKFLAGLDVFITLVILIAWAWLKTFENSEDYRLNKKTYNASMYTLAISNLPTNIETYRELANLDNENNEIDPENESQEFVEEVLRNHFKLLLNQEHSSIAYVCVAYNNEDEIRESIKRGDLIRQKIKLANEFRAHKHKDDTPEQNEKKLEKLKEDTHKINTQLEEKLKILDSYATRPVKILQAYVTFNTIEDRNQAEKLYNDRPLLSRLFPSPSLKINNKMPRVYAAAEPGIILWENLHYGALNRIVRRFISNYCATFWIILSLLITFGSKYKQEIANADPENEQKAIESQILTVIAAIFVCVMNIFIEMTLHYFSKFEKHHTKDNKNKSMLTRIFVLQFINTSIIFLFENSASILHALGIKVMGGHLEFTANWYNTIGVTVILVQICNMFTTHVYKWIQFKSYMRKKNYYKAHPEVLLTQDELNKAFVGPHLDYSVNYGHMLATIFVCLTFSTAMPVLYLLCIGFFIIYYRTEKYFFIHMYKNPNYFNAITGKRVTAIIPFALLIHLWTAIWMLTNTEIFDNPSLDSNSDSGKGSFAYLLNEKAIGKSTMPLFILFLLLLVGRFAYVMIKKFYEQVYKCVSRYCCDLNKMFGIKPPKEPTKLEYWEAIQADSIKGLKNYNILQNNKYKEAFAITTDFAASHKTVRHVRKMKYKASDSGTPKETLGQSFYGNKSFYGGGSVASNTPKRGIPKLKSSRFSMTPTNNSNSNSNTTTPKKNKNKDRSGSVQLLAPIATSIADTNTHLTVQAAPYDIDYYEQSSVGGGASYAGGYTGYQQYPGYDPYAYGGQQQYAAQQQGYYAQQQQQGGYYDPNYDQYSQAGGSVQPYGASQQQYYDPNYPQYSTVPYTPQPGNQQANDQYYAQQQAYAQYEAQQQQEQNRTPTSTTRQRHNATGSSSSATTPTAQAKSPSSGKHGTNYAAKKHKTEVKEMNRGFSRSFYSPEQDSFYQT